MTRTRHAGSVLSLLRKCPPLTGCESQTAFSIAPRNPSASKLADVAAYDTRGVASVKIVCPEFVVGHTVAHDVVRDFEDLVADGNDRFFVTSMSLHSVVAGLQRGRARAGRGQSTFNQNPSQIAIRLSGSARPALARAFVLLRGPAFSDH